MPSDLHRTFVTTLLSLPDSQRRLLALNEFDGLGAEGVGQALGMTRAQARVGLLRARQAMCRRLAERMRVPMVSP